MNKIRLTESQLHRVIVESVKKILTEMDPKTYWSAARKDRQRDISDWDQDFRYADKVYSDPNLKARYDKYYKHHDRYHDFLDKADSEYEKSVGGRMKGGGPSFIEYRNFYNKTPEFFVVGGPDATKADFDKCVKNWQEMNDFNNGKYEYIKGKGWQLK